MYSDQTSTAYTASTDGGKISSASHDGNDEADSDTTKLSSWGSSLTDASTFPDGQPGLDHSTRDPIVLEESFSGNDNVPTQIQGGKTRDFSCRWIKANAAPLETTDCSEIQQPSTPRIEGQRKDLRLTSANIKDISAESSIAELELGPPKLNLDEDIHGLKDME